MVIQALQKVFRKPMYALFALIGSAAIFTFAVWLPNIPLIVLVMGHPGIPFSQKLDLPISLLGSIVTNFTALSASYTIAIAVLFGVHLSMIVYFLRRRIDDVRQTGIGTGFLGIASGVLGMGCAACGSFLLTSTLSLFGASGILAFLPLAGGEFGIMGVILLAVSVYLTAKKIQNPAVCRINS
ncbi:MAG: hypothetical protein A3E07_02695 [Candidatus Wildermuthbacteria bacterium RIFCSPHIGHO2_12_FULL_45_9]|uniref:Uncharacterized protein n=1 Tax=Candidatus Wildermuthbacteria bacterium RIFCSPHIGHO2_02_FULL_45_25 TaxID=1802450 RepID=A0A1G2R250_9BACT|nr:MAG: hypothetical protein A2748_02525 [Candidatus Wildermuthbacteria bacterium RIFCSPHIGHO2_01_FULL_45_20]OHA66787.1 MAG: hypothetical protein A3C04_04195 [Candidatus Wildermuthbacteria bacterium RIFCSPHIGHO2_02_FULL_45_25]OHA71547.1 MAG: hypothetical protein A3E07_02695 [Candidatus Wildermuthbacteria bacterium RIFCSPHIGHO2_12_FULL_45_9]